MKLSRRLRSLAALLALTGVLLAQLAVAAYACPGPQGMAMAAVAGDASPELPCCGDGVPYPEPALCSAHCQQADQSLDKPAAPLVPVLAASGFAIDFCALAPRPPSPGEQPSLLARSCAPSVAVRHCRFLI